MNALKAAGIKTVMLTGDSKATADKVAADKVGGEKSGKPRRRRRAKSAVDPLAPATKREPQPSLFSEDDAHDPFDIDLSAALPPQEESAVHEDEPEA